MDYEQAWNLIAASIERRHATLKECIDKYGHTAPKDSPSLYYIDGKLDTLYYLALEIGEIAKQHDLPNPFVANT